MKNNISISHKLIYSLTFVIFVSSCSLPVKEQLAFVEKQTISNDSFLTFNYKPLQIEKKTSFKFSKNSPVYSFGDNKSYYAAFELPDDKEVYLEMRSKTQGLFNDKFVDPVFILLDSSHNPLYVFRLDLTPFIGVWVEPSMRGYTQLPVNAKYMIVFAGGFDDKDLSFKYKQGPEIIMAGKQPLALHNHEERTQEFTRVLTGKLSVNLKRFKN